MHGTMPATTESLRFGFARTRLGLALVALGDRGVVAILLGDEQARLRRDLAQAFPEARLLEDATATATAAGKVIALIDDPQAGLDLPLDLRGSPLEHAVWEALQSIPSGETRTYGAIASGLDLPATAQEVGAACAANRLAVAVPCHRVVKADGGLAGYRWGVHRKRRLINLEAVAASRRDDAA